MESLSSVATIVRIAQDIAGAVATVSRNRSQCRKLATRVEGIGDLLRELHGSEEAGAGTMDAATRRLLGRLEDALRRALQLVRSCLDSSFPRSLLAGGRQADQFDEVDREINRCLLELGVANHILIARLLHQNFKDEKDNRGVAEKGGDKQRHCGCASGGYEIEKEKAAAMAAAAANNTGLNYGPAPYSYLPFDMALVPIATDESMYEEPSLPYNFFPYPQGPPSNAQTYRHRVPTPAKTYDGGGDTKDTGLKDDCAKDDDLQMAKLAVDGDSDKKKEPEPTGGGDTKDRDKTAAGVDAGNFTIDVPVDTVNAGMHELVPPPSYGYGDWACTQGLDTGGCYHDGAGAQSDAAAYYNHHLPFLDMLSEENPNACAII